MQIPADYRASVAFLDSLWELERDDDLGALLSGMQVCDSDDGPFTRDPAFLDDWNKHALKIEGPHAGYDTLIAFLRGKAVRSRRTNFISRLADRLELERAKYITTWKAVQNLAN